MGISSIWINPSLERNIALLLTGKLNKNSLSSESDKFDRVLINAIMIHIDESSNKIIGTNKLSIPNSLKLL